MQGYNVQVVASPEQIILPAAQVTQALNDGDQLEPMVTQTAAELAPRAGVEEPIGTVLADGGYWNSAAISRSRRGQIDVLIPTKNRKRSKTSAVPRPHRARKPTGRIGSRHARGTNCSLTVPSKPDRRAGLRQHQPIPPPDRPLPTPRLTRLPGRVAANCRHPQPPQTLAPP